MASHTLNNQSPATLIQLVNEIQFHNTNQIDGRRVANLLFFLAYCTNRSMHTQHISILEASLNKYLRLMFSTKYKYIEEKVVIIKHNLHTSRRKTQ